MQKIHVTLIAVASFSTALSAQEPPPRPAKAPVPAPARVAKPSTAPVRAPRPAEAVSPVDYADAIDQAIERAMIAPLPPLPGQYAGLPFLAPLAPVAPEPAIAVYPMPDFQGRGLSRAELERIAEEAREQARAVSRMDLEMIREQALTGSRMAIEQGRAQAEIARTQASQALDFARMNGELARMGEGFSGLTLAGGLLSDRPPSSWAQRDPADSLWRAANEVMNKGDYRRAAALFKEIPVKFQYSAYAADAMYWTAHALYRVGSTPDLQDALQTLDQLKQKYPNSRLRGSQTDVAALQVRIAGVLSARGQGGTDIVKRALANNASVCDREEQQIRAAALNALMQTDAAAASDYATKMLAQNDDCSRELRRSAVFLIGNKGDPSATATLIRVARTDASIDVRQSAVQYLGRMPGDGALGALEELAKSDTSQQIQREAIRQLARNSNPRARNGIKAMVEREDMAENLRIAALDALDPERSTQEDVAWLQATYAKVASPRIRSRIISAMARIGGSQNEQWFVTLANNENESIDVRVEALRRAGQSMEIAALGRLYDQTGQRNLRYELVRQLGNRREPAATDKLGEIAKNGTDVEVRRRAVEVLADKAKTDERAAKLLLGLIDRP